MSSYPGRGDKGYGRDGSADAELGLEDVFGGIVRRDRGLCRRGGFENVILVGERILEDHIIAEVFRTAMIIFDSLGLLYPGGIRALLS